MRIATSTIYEQQTAAIDSQVYLQSQYGNELSTGKAVNEPSDSPAYISEDLALHQAIGVDNTGVTNSKSVAGQMTQTDSSLSQLTAVLQSARQLAVQSANDVLSPENRTALADQVDGYFSQAVGIANTEFNGKYLFAGTAELTSAPVTTAGPPANTVNFTGNLAHQTQTFDNNQTVQTSVSLQDAFNYQAANGSPDVFQVLSNLRTTLVSTGVVDQTPTSMNAGGHAIDPAGLTIAQNETAGNFNPPLTYDSNGNVAFTITTAAGSFTANVNPAVTTLNGLIAQINGSGIGVTASFNYQTQRFALNAQVDFTVADAPSPGATNSANAVEVFGLSGTASTTTDISRQIADIDNVLNQVLVARASLGSNLNTVQSVQSQMALESTNNTTSLSGIEDANIAQVATQFTATQTVLQAAYATTSKLESKTLFDYMS